MKWFAPEVQTALPDDEVSTVRYLGPSPNPHFADAVDNLHPQAFMVELGEGFGKLDTHFHSVDQFQLFVGGAAKFGPHQVSPRALHYADRLQPYGPLIPAEGGISFLTLRAKSDTSTFYMPIERETLKEYFELVPEASKSRRSMTMELDEIAVERDGTWFSHIEDEDGLRIAICESGPGQVIETLRPGSAGGYLVLLGGDLVDGDLHRSGSFAFVGRGHAVEGLTAARDGARMVYFGFPSRA